MSLYRQPGRTSSRTLALAVAAALVAGLLGGVVIGRATKSEPTLADNVAGLRDALRPAREGIEILPTEYAQGVRAGRVIAPAEYGGARSAVRRARDAVRSARADLRAYDPVRAAALERRVADLEAAVERRADAAVVDRAARAAAVALAAVSGQS